MKKLLATLVVCLLIIILTLTCFVGCKEIDDNVIRVNEVTHSVFYAPLYIAIDKRRRIRYYNDRLGIKKRGYCIGRTRGERVRLS